VSERQANETEVPVEALELTGSATDMVVASSAQARLTIAIEVNAAKSRHPGLKCSAVSSAGSAMFGKKETKDTG
jgi:hypothetical protein